MIFKKIILLTCTLVTFLYAKSPLASNLHCEETLKFLQGEKERLVIIDSFEGLKGYSEQVFSQKFMEMIEQSSKKALGKVTLPHNSEDYRRARHDFINTLKNGINLLDIEQSESHLIPKTCFSVFAKLVDRTSDNLLIRITSSNFDRFFKNYAVSYNVENYSLFDLLLYFSLSSDGDSGTCQEFIKTKGDTVTVVLICN